MKDIDGSIRVWAGKWEKGSQSDILYTRGIGACIGVAIYDRLTKIGHMAHVFSTDSSQREVLEPMIESVIDLRSNEPSSLKGWVVGGSSEADMASSRLTDPVLRMAAISRLGELGLDDQSLTVEWNNDESLLVGMSLDCAEGEVTTIAKLIPPIL